MDIDLSGSIYSIISIFLDSLFTGCLFSLLTKKAEGYDLTDGVSRRALQAIPSTLIITTYLMMLCFPLWSIINCSLSQMDVWYFLYKFYRSAQSCIPSLYVYLLYNQNKVFSYWGFFLLVFISNSFTLTWFMIIFIATNTSLNFIALI